MASYSYGAPHYHSNVSSHNHHHGRSRRGPRVASQNAHRQYKAQRSPKEIPETPTLAEYIHKLEAAKSFDLDDDEVFCPFHLLSEDDVRHLSARHKHLQMQSKKRSTNDRIQLHSIHSSSSSDRGSLASSSPENSPLQQQAQPTPSFLLPNANNSFHPVSNSYQQQQHMKLHQPMAQRTRNAIPIVDPSTRAAASPPLSVSPGRQMQQQFVPRGRW